jgi:hypothetical protein
MENQMKKFLGIVATVLLLSTGVASAATVTGDYSVSFNGSAADASLFQNLSSPFSITEGASSVQFISITPNFCIPCYGNTETGAISVTFSNLKVNGVSVTAPGAISGMYSATYTGFDNGTDSIVWTGESGGVLAVALAGADLNLIDGSDWTVTSNISATALAATPLPAALPLFAGGLGLLGAFGLTRKRKPSISAFA